MIAAWPSVHWVRAPDTTNLPASRVTQTLVAVIRDAAAVGATRASFAPDVSRRRRRRRRTPTRRTSKPEVSLGHPTMRSSVPSSPGRSSSVPSALGFLGRLVHDVDQSVTDMIASLGIETPPHAQ
jgi:hypothetical protein